MFDPVLSQRYERSAGENVFLRRSRAAVPSMNGETCERMSSSKQPREVVVGQGNPREVP